MKRLHKKSGFTLVELMVALTISIIVFSAMGMILSRCFSLWVDASAHWKLAQHARVARSRLLNGAFGNGTGLLSSTNVTVGKYGTWDLIRFYPVADSGLQEVYGWPGSAPNNIWMKRNSDGKWAWAQSVGYYGTSDETAVKAGDFEAVVSDEVITITYTLNFGAMGKNFQQEQTIRAFLVNE